MVAILCPPPLVRISGPKYTSLTKTDFQSGTSASFASFAIGTANANRHVIFAVTSFRSGGPSVADSATANTGAISVTNKVNLQAGDFSAELWIGKIPTGTTAQLSLVYGGTVPSRISVTVWTVLMSSATTHGTATGTTSGSASHAISAVSIPAGGFGIAVMATDIDATASTINQSFVERTDVSSGGLLYSYGADKESVAGMASSTVTISSSASTTDSAQVFASWQGDGT